MANYGSVLTRLRELGWTVVCSASPRELPSDVQERYEWVPVDVRAIIGEVLAAESPDEKAWLLGAGDFDGSTGAAFKWNEWEQLSLDAAQGDPELVSGICAFWDTHFPVGMSTKRGYAYFALRRSDLQVVVGEEPEFEESARAVAASFQAFLEALAAGDPKFVRWV